MMREADRRRHADGPQLLIEELALRYQADHDPDVADELLRRCQPLRSTMVRRLARLHHILRADVPDLVQIANMAILEAGDQYQSAYPFPAFAKRVIRFRCSNQIRSQQRAESHLDHTCDGTLLLDDQPSPEQAALRQEDWELLAQVFRQLEPKEQRLWELLANRVKVTRIAMSFTMSPSQAHRWVKRFLAKIRLLLPEEQG
jgi:RNA polymerase sigma factor (sigma-70 family)